MTLERMMELLDIEHACVLRNRHGICNRKCENCELVQDDGELSGMYTEVIGLLKEQERKRGHWIGYPECLGYDGAYSDTHYVCSECNQVFDCMDNCMEDWKCCPGCGALMKGEQK